ncbi:hypothetical protein MDAP_002097 [Mitosporidium daphniae]|uniref:Ribosomal protein mS38 C-terminal domain-containing protein n=1 Tax=Mitosporidium daphniae TaxID=1485682 RepID=A0A098VNJ1_9MICR|nr:uncharacterized protein DI09_61p100 [Mitosporidium daphniae]KGG50623.1 hypothetical protein DI09_61p100 [Mitosporidium daphniae]|eukprot:XP_013237050.1 uncharacterized protein DI09_61p100 [Mitosporidium daphniae]
MLPAVRRLSSIAHGLSPSTRPGFIRADEIEKLFASMKLFNISSSPPASEVNGENKPSATPASHMIRRPTKTELATIRLFPKGRFTVSFVVVQFLRNQDYPFQPRALLQPLSSTTSSEDDSNQLYLTPSSENSPFAAPIFFANVKKKRKSRMNKHKRKKRRRALRYKASSNK